MRDKNTTAIGYNLVMINAFVYIASSVYGPFLSQYFASNNMDPMQIGVLMTVSPIASIIIQPLWAMLSDKTGKRKKVLSIVVLGSAFSLFGFYIGNTFLSYLLAMLCFSAFVTSIVPLSDAIIIREANKINYDFAIIRMGGTIGFSITVVIAGRVLLYNPSSLYFMGFLGYLCLLIFVLRLNADPSKQHNVSEDIPKNALVKKVRGLMGIFKTKQIIFVLAYALISQIGLSFYWSFLGVYLLDLGYGQSTLGWLNSISALTEIPTLLFIKRLTKRYGPMRILFASCIILSLRIGLVTMGSLSYIVVAQLLQGISYMTIYFSCAVYINENVRPGKQSQGQSYLALVQTGIGSIVGNIVGGQLVGRLGITFAYASMAAAIIITAVSIALIQLLYSKKLN